LPREKQDYREILARLNAVFPDRGAITLEEAARYYGVCTRTLTRDKSFPVGPHKRVELTKFARWLA
jgi:hypothetical protein